MTPETTARPLPTRLDAIALFRGKFREALEGIKPETLALTLDELEELRNPSEIDYLLRKNLWKQVELAKKSGFDELTTASIYSPVCSSQAFDKVMKNDVRLAWLLMHPREAIDEMRSLLSMGMARMRKDFMTMPMNERTAGHFLKAIDLLMNRVHGPVAQKIEAKHAHLNLNKPRASQLETPNDVIARLDELKEKLLPKEVTPIEVEDES
jgi:hypothetical protein